MVYCVYSLESPRYEKENRPRLAYICRYGIFSKGPKNKFETAVVNEPYVFEPLKILCNLPWCYFTYHTLGSSESVFDICIISI